MVERIENRDNLHYWRVEESEQTHKDKKGRDDGASQDGYSSPYEKTDWQVLFDKSQLWKRNIEIRDDEIDQILFRKINFKTDPSLLRVEIVLVGGSRINPAFVSVSRAEALKIKNFKPGEAIPKTTLLKDPKLVVTVPSNPDLFSEEESRLAKTAAKARLAQNQYEDSATVTVIGKSPLNKKVKVRSEIIALYGVILFLLFILLAGAFIFIKL